MLWRPHPSYLQMFSHLFQSRDWTLDPAALCKFVAVCENKGSFVFVCGFCFVLRQSHLVILAGLETTL